MSLVRTMPWRKTIQGVPTEIFRKEVKDVEETKSITDRFIRRKSVVLEGFGTPMTFWKLIETSTECYCFGDNAPDRRHNVCYGSGYLNGYQKYGYSSHTYASTSTDVVLSNVYKTRDGKKLMLKTGTAGSIVTDFITLTNLKEYISFEHDEDVSSGNSVVYQYSYDGNAWTTFTDITTLSLSATKVKFRANLSRSASARKPAVHWFRVRWRNKNKLSEDNVTFPTIVVPAVMAAKGKAERVLTGTSEGIVTTMPIRFEALSDMHLEGRDLCMFITGEYQDKRFRAENIVEATYGKTQKILHVEFDVHFIRDDEDVFGIAYSLP